MVRTPSASSATASWARSSWRQTSLARKAANRLKSTPTETKNGPAMPMQLAKNGLAGDRWVIQVIRAESAKSTTNGATTMPTVPERSQ